MSQGKCNGPMYNDPVTRLTDKNSYTTSYNDRHVITFTWNEWHAVKLNHCIVFLNLTYFYSKMGCNFY